EVGSVGRRAPGMTILRNLAVAVEVIEQYELLGDRVVIRRDFAAEENQAGVAVALGDIAENLDVRAILLDDVEDVLDGGTHAGIGGNHRVALEVGLDQQLIAIRRVVDDLFGVLAEFGAVGRIDEGEESVQVVAVVYETALHVFANRAR